jgi:ATP-binding cassette subfamily F protein 3
LVEQRTFNPFDGDLDDYQRYLLDEAKRMREAAKEAGKTATPAPAPAAAPSTLFNPKTLQRDLDKIDTEIAALQLEKDGLDEKLAAAKNPHEIGQAGKRLKKVCADMAALEERWMALSEQLESAGA